MISKLSNDGEEIELHVITNTTKDFKMESDENFTDLVSSVLGIGIKLTYEYAENHDRYILSDNGWKIKLGRGLDIFEKTEGKFNIAKVSQEQRQCRNCEITYLNV